MPKRKTYLGMFGRRLFLMMAALSLGLGGSLGFLGYWNAEKTITHYAKTRLEMAARDRSRRIDLWFVGRKREISLVALLPGFVESLERIIEGRDTPFDSLRIAYILRIHQETYVDYGACGVFDVQGRMLVRSADCPHQPSEPPCPEFYRALETDEPVLGKLRLVENDETGLKLAKSIKNLQGKTIGVLIMQLLPENALLGILSDYTGLGKTGEVFLVGADTTLLTPERNHLHPQPITHKIPTEGALRCLSGIDSVGEYLNFSGEKVLGAYVWLPNLQWALMAEISVKEAFTSLYKVGITFLIVLIAGIGLVFALTMLLSRQLTKPLYRLTEASDAVALGNLDIVIRSESRDEVGQLSRQFDHMVKAIKSSRSQIEKSNRELIQSEKLAAVGRLVASIVHEMRNPLSAIKMNIRILQKKGGGGDLETEHLQIASAQTARLEKMLNELLEYSKPVKVNFAPVELRQLINRTLDAYSELLQSKNLRLERDFPNEEVEIISDADLLTRIIDNLVTNAASASKPGKRLKVQVLAGEPAAIVVSDEGKGMSEKALARLFEPFFTTREDGIGLGMSNVKKFIDVLGGSIEVNSAEGEGTTVILKFSRK